jgi:hypothetical protein
MLTYRTIVLTALVALLMLHCSRRQPEEHYSGGGYDPDISTTNTVQSGQPIDINALSCEQLAFLAEKYESIAVSAERNANGDSPAAQASYALALRARNYLIQIYGVRARKAC